MENASQNIKFFAASLA